MFQVHYGKLTLKIYSKGERVRRIEVIIHNTKDLPGSRPLQKFPKVVQWLRGITDRFLETLRCIDSCFIAADTLEQLPAPAQVGGTRVDGIDCNKPRIRTVMQAVVALSTSPTGFSASDLVRKANALNNPSGTPYTARQAVYDLRKPCGQEFVEKIGNSRPTSQLKRPFAP